jgi:hypothetical protein
MPRFYVDWSPFPKGPWVVRDTLTGRAAPAPSGNGFRHYDCPELARRVADRLNRQRMSSPGISGK